MHSPKISGDIIEILTQGNFKYLLDTRHYIDRKSVNDHPLLVEISAYGHRVYRREEVPREQIIIENDETGHHAQQVMKNTFSLLELSYSDPSHHIRRVTEKAPSAVPQPSDKVLYSHILNLGQKMPNGQRMDLLDGATGFLTREVVKSTVLEGEARENAARELDEFYEKLNKWGAPLANFRYSTGRNSYFSDFECS